MAEALKIDGDNGYLYAAPDCDGLRIEIAEVASDEDSPQGETWIDRGEAEQLRDYLIDWLGGND